MIDKHFFSIDIDNNLIEHWIIYLEGRPVEYINKKPIGQVTLVVLEDD